MARKRKKARSGAQGDAEQPAAPKPAPRIGTGLGALFEQAGVTKIAPRSAVPKKAPPPKPASPRTLPPPGPAALRPVDESDEPVVRSGTELRILNDAYAGAQPLSQKAVRARKAPLPPANAALSSAQLRAQLQAEDAAARARLDALVAGAVRWKLQSDGAAREFVTGLREGASPKLLERLGGKSFAPDATLDLHGVRAAEVAQQVASFVRKHARAGARHLLVITGKGLHSAGGTSTLRQVTIDALTQSGAAPLVVAFATAHASHGGSGALAVLLQ